MTQHITQEPACPECGAELLYECVACSHTNYPNESEMKQRPYAWAIQGCSRMWIGEFAELDAKAEAKRCGGTCHAYPLYTAEQVSTKPLSDDEIIAIAVDTMSVAPFPDGYILPIMFARAILAKVCGKPVVPIKVQP